MKRIIVVASILLFTACATCRYSAADDQLFDALDVDKDGAVTMGEMKSQKLVIESGEDGVKEVHPADGANESESKTPMTFEQKRRLLEDIDQNKDGSINRQEWNRASPDGFILWKF
jgi:Ca2+-binding EF-hand superfamily protein